MLVKVFMTKPLNGANKTDNFRGKIIFIGSILLIGLIGGAIGGGYFALQFGDLGNLFDRSVKSDTKNVVTIPGVGSIINNTGGDSKIDIRIEPQDPDFQNNQLPGYSPSTGFTTPPPELSNFEGASRFTEDMKRSGYAYFSPPSNKIVISNKLYSPVFYLAGSRNEIRRVAFELSGKQKAVLLQFGLEDLESGSDNLTYNVTVFADNQKAWSGEVRYGSSQQLVSAPLKLPGVTTLVVEYSITQGNSSRNLFFTRAELIF